MGELQGLAPVIDSAASDHVQVTVAVDVPHRRLGGATKAANVPILERQVTAIAWPLNAVVWFGIILGIAGIAIGHQQVRPAIAVQVHHLQLGKGAAPGPAPGAGTPRHPG